MLINVMFRSLSILLSRFSYPSGFHSRRCYRYRTLLSGLDGRGLWIKSLLLDVSPQSVCGIFKSGLSGSKPEDAAHRWRRNVEYK